MRFRNQGCYKVVGHSPTPQFLDGFGGFAAKTT
jgi:hypothetical protein